MSRAAVRLIAAALLLAAGSAWSSASAGERAALARLAAELATLERLVAEAERRRPPGGRVAFDYPQLRADLGLIAEGIRHYVEDIRDVPRADSAINGGYVRRHAP